MRGNSLARHVLVDDHLVGSLLYYAHFDQFGYNWVAPCGNGGGRLGWSFVGVIIDEAVVLRSASQIFAPGFLVYRADQCLLFFGGDKVTENGEALDVKRCGHRGIVFYVD